MIYLNYVDDGILLSCHGTKLDAMIADLKTELKLTREGDLSAYLGIQIEKCPDSGSLLLYLTTLTLTVMLSSEIFYL